MIVIEANEIPKDIFEWYSRNSNGILAKTINEFGIVTTVLDDVEEEFLYPSQAWASISTGSSASKHKIRWYNDAKPENNFYWRDVSKKKLNVALMNVLHTGSISDEEKNQYDFIFPDFFCLKPEVSIKKYKNFQVFNHKMSVSSGRKTSKKTLLLNSIVSFLSYPSLSAWGLSLKDYKKWLSIIISVKNDSESLRNAQFILQQRIFIDIIKKGFGKDLSVFFTNHIASCLHRNFHDLKNNLKSDEQKKMKIYRSMKMLDDFLWEVKKLNVNREILILSAMGQKLNTKVNDNYKDVNKLDYKLVDHFMFLKFFDLNLKDVQVLYEMVPQYTFKFLNQNALADFVKKIDLIGSDPEAMRFGYYVPKGKRTKNTKGFFCHLDINENKITCTMTVRPDKDNNIILNGEKIHFEQIGFNSLNVNDFHHGEHSKYGCMITFKDKTNNEDKHFTEIKKFILSKI